VSCLYHAAPLQYLPHILKSQALYAKSVLAAQGIHPRASAVRRDRMLGLTDWVHLSLHPNTPLLRDKLAKGYPHALFVFERAAVLALPEVALLPYNTKAWRTRSACQPVTDPGERAALLRCSEETDRYPSLEVLVRYGLGLEHLTQIAFVTASEQQMVQQLLDALALPLPAPVVTDVSLLPVCDYQPTTIAAIAAYFEECRRAGTLSPPPPIPFD